jgi:hypothetical protein
LADDVTFGAGNNATPPDQVKAATDEITTGPHTGAHAGVAKLAVSANGDGTHIPATAAGGLLVDVSNATLVVDASGATVPVSNTGLTELAGAIDGTEVQVDIVGSIPAGNNNIGDVDIASLPNEGQQTMANSISVAIASDQGPIEVDGSVEAVDEPYATAAQTSVADNAADVELLAANAARKRWAVTNDSTVTLYVSYDGAASLTNYFVQVPPNSFFSDDHWVGEVRGIWSSDPGTGAARLVEIEA